AEQARFQTDPLAMKQILGVDEIDPDYVEIFSLSDLDQLGLAGYLIEGCGVPADAVATERERLNAVTGYVMLVHSRAFGGHGVTLTPTLPLIATFNEPATDWSAEKIETQSAQLSASTRPATRPAPRQTRAQTRRIGAIVFMVFMLIIAALILKVVL
ncbi:MAG: hypothetical protein KUG70_05775, partial [Rhodobacteraceae bacterium]|nr:hypothetical protein [Paracoccaceae bacterium]